jgi:glycosyltransferase involved in cell wall biosynthesis
LKLAVFTPFVNDSAVARVTNEVFVTLKSNYDVSVDIYTSLDENIITTELNIVFYNIDDLKEMELAKYDYCFYILGNNHAFHRECYLASKLHPGIVVLHDQTMAGFWRSVFSCDTHPGRWLSERELLFGKLPSYRTLAWEEFIGRYDFRKMPHSVSLRPIFENVIGVFTHAEFFAGFIAESYNLPVEYAYIPLYSKQSSNDDSTVELDDIINKARKQGRKIVVSTGIVHPVKRNDKIASVLLNNDKLRKKICYILIGENGGGYCARLASYSEHELKGSLFMLGRRPDQTMFHAIAEADMCINLRYPNSEVCSLSLFEQMSQNKAVLVIGSGIYNELPENTVLKLELDSSNLLTLEYNYISDDYSDDYREINGELKSIEGALQKLVCGEIDTIEIGNNAAHFLSVNATKEIYAKKIASFLDNLAQQRIIKGLQHKFITAVKDRSETLFGHLHEFPHYTEDIIIDIDRLFNQKPSEKAKKKHITLGIWYAFPGTIPTLDREGVSVFTGNLCEALVNDYDINLEVWVYSWNVEPVSRVFANIPSSRLTIVTEQNFSIVLKSETHIAVEFGGIGEHNYWRFTEAARLFSKADLFMPVILYLDNAVYTGKPIVAIAHDLFTVYLREMFAAAEHGNEIYFDTLERVTNLARKNSTFVTPAVSTFARQLQPFIKNLRRQNVTVIRSPKNTLQNKELLSENETRKLIGTHDPYLFYPTQVRPHKNFQLLISAFALILKKNPKLKLALTGELKDVPSVWNLAQELKMEKSIINLGRLSNTELYSCYKYALCTPAPTMYEATLCLQAVEAMSVGTPVVLTDADMNRDEIESAGLSNVIPLIPGDNAQDFADEIEYVIHNRDAAIKRQEPLFAALTKRTWNDAAGEYYMLFLEILSQSGH